MGLVSASFSLKLCVRHARVLLSGADEKIWDKKLTTLQNIVHALRRFMIYDVLAAAALCHDSTNPHRSKGEETLDIMYLAGVSVLLYFR